MSDANASPFLTVIIPAYNEEKRLPPNLVRIADFLRAQPYTSEVLIVENGSTDRTSQVVEAFQAESVQAGDPFTLQLLHSPKGKGNAVKHGVQRSRGEFLLITDADLSVPVEETPRFLPPVLARRGYGVAIASREIEGSVRHGEPAYRHFMGRIFNWLVRVLAVPKIHDTQCGFKCFSREAAELIFPRQRIDGWGFDVELLYIAQHHNVPIVEIPVNWYYQENSRVRPVRDTITMVNELLRIRRNGRAGLYNNVTSEGVADEITATQ